MYGSRELLYFYFSRHVFPDVMLMAYSNVVRCLAINRPSHRLFHSGSLASLSEPSKLAIPCVGSFNL